MEGLKKEIEKILNKMPLKERVRYHITISDRFSREYTEIKPNNDLVSILVSGVEKYSGLNGEYASLEELETKVETYRKRYKVDLCLRDGEILLGRGKVKSIGSYKVI